MRRERWHEVTELYHSALARAPDNRVEYLRQSCGEDENLLEEVSSLIRSHDSVSPFMEEPAISRSQLGVIEEELARLNVGRRIGSYELIRLIGSGGMGSVYLAKRADQQYQKKVALKLIKRGMDTDLVVRRFLNERQILANVDHPNIARLLDGGVTVDGTPFYVMEYVEGMPVDQYCDSRRMPILDRVSVFCHICSAVQHAHRNLVVHRDLKPGNILVTEDGVPKLLDFGIAKLLGDAPDSSSELTRAAFPILTPGYASPEQFRGEIITTASDTYSLGVLLYKLLSGHDPYQLHKCSPGEAASRVCDSDPEKASVKALSAEEFPSIESGGRTAVLTREAVSELRSTTPEKLRRSLAGDLDNILSKAMQKEPQRRYGSAEQFEEDLHRLLEGRPVIARPSTFAYRSRKFLARNKAMSAAMVLILTSLVGGTIGTSWQAHVAKAERARAERRFNDVRTLANSFLFEFHDAIKDLPGSTPARELLVQKALQYLDSLAKESARDPALQRELAAAYEKVGDVQGQFYAANLGRPDAAVDSYKRAVEIGSAVIADNPGHIPMLRELSSAYGKLGNAQYLMGSPKEALESTRKGLEISRSVSEADPSNRLDLEQLATSYLAYGWSQSALNEVEPALKNCQEAVSILQDLSNKYPREKSLRVGLAVAYGRVGQVFQLESRFPESLAAFQRTLSIREGLLADDPASVQVRHHVAQSHVTIGNILAEMKEPAAALQHQQQASAVLDSLSAADPKNMQLRQDRAGVLGNIGGLLSQTGDADAAIRALHQALDLFASLPAAHTSVVIRFTVAKDQLRLGKAFSVLAAKAKTSSSRQQNWREAKAWFEKSRPVFTDLRARGIATGPDAALADEAAAEISRCDKALRR